MRRWLILFLLFLVASSMIGVGYHSWRRVTHSTTQVESDNPHAHLPAFVQAAGAAATVAYQYAIVHPEILEQIPCHCGCEKALAHKNNLACYVKSFPADGAVADYDEHAAYCAVCLDITQQVIKRIDEGERASAIHAAIDRQYAYTGPHPHVIGTTQ